MNAADSYIIDLFDEVKKQLSNYSETIRKISSLIDNNIERMIAKVDPNPQNKLRVLNLPSTTEINKSIENQINHLKNIKDDIIKNIDEVERILRERRLTCPYCNGHGKIPTKKEYIREDDIITPEIKYENCNECDGRGFLEVSNEILENATSTLNTIKSLRRIMDNQ
ncbi:MAG: hypothetical protein ACP5IZ_11500 [Thermoprotei archaeon]|jgi:hypothetical protein